jgi:hypothetical protein
MNRYQQSRPPRGRMTNDLRDRTGDEAWRRPETTSRPQAYPSQSHEPWYPEQDDASHPTRYLSGYERTGGPNWRDERYFQGQRDWDSSGGSSFTDGPPDRPRWELRQEPRRYQPGPKGYTRSDERIREDISERLFSSYDIDSSEVSVTVVSGKVTLDGTVPERWMKHSIEDIADACAGVNDVNNLIRASRFPTEDNRTSVRSETEADAGATLTTGAKSRERGMQ